MNPNDKVEPANLNRDLAGRVRNCRYVGLRTLHISLILIIIITDRSTSDIGGPQIMAIMNNRTLSSGFPAEKKEIQVNML